MSERKGFNFYRSYFDVYEELTKSEDKIKFIDALLRKQFFGEDPKNLKGMSKFAYMSQKHSIDKQVKGFEDKTGTTLGPTQGCTQGPSVQEKGQEKGKVQVQEKGQEEKEAEFKNSLLPYLEQYGNDMLNNFYLYWTEKNEKGKKMRFEYSKNQPFNISRRLVTWSKREKEYKEKSSAKKEKSEMEKGVDQIYNLLGTFEKDE